MKKRSVITGAFAAAGMLILILDSKTAIAGAKDGLELCIKTLIPSLFPFFILSILLTGSLEGQSIKFLRPIGKLCHIPEGAESLMAVGFLGGYPVGAQNIALACENGSLSPGDARRMMAFCNNAGPAFLFGVVGSMFESAKIPWILWLIHIVSALAVGMVLPKGDSMLFTGRRAEPMSVTGAMEKSVRVLALVCGWVLLFRMLIAFLERWCLWLLPVSVQTALAGLLELSNGCVRLMMIECVGQRFVTAAVLLALGGICVTMQTVSASKNVSMALYFPGKLLQGALSFLLAVLIQFLFPAGMRWEISPIAVVICAILSLILVLFLQKQKKSSSIPAPIGV